MARNTPTGSSAGPRRGRAAERGYTLAVLLGVLTVMTIALAAAIPHWVAIETRERESELIARGFQYAEAIRVFQQRFGRLPNRLEELVEVEPRTLRQLWTDPMSDGQPFLVLMELGSAGAVVAVDPETGQMIAPPGEAQEEGGSSAPPPRPGPPTAGGFGGGPGVAGPIHGVRSRAHGESYHTLFGQTDVGEWEFTVERLAAATTAQTAQGLLRRVDYATIGRPFRYPPPGGIPGMQLPPPGQGGAQPRPPQPLPGQRPPAPTPRNAPGSTSGRNGG